MNSENRQMAGKLQYNVRDNLMNCFRTEPGLNTERRDLIEHRCSLLGAETEPCPCDRVFLHFFLVFVVNELLFM